MLICLVKWTRLTRVNGYKCSECCGKLKTIPICPLDASFQLDSKALYTYTISNIATEERELHCKYRTNGCHYRNHIEIAVVTKLSSSSRTQLQRMKHERNLTIPGQVEELMNLRSVACTHKLSRAISILFTHEQWIFFSSRGEISLESSHHYWIWLACQ